jgi:hypothetical protein
MPCSTYVHVEAAYPSREETIMHVVRFFPIGNADTCLIELSNGRRALFDFADMHNPDDKYDLRCDLVFPT